MNDIELINRIIEGDRVGFNQLIRKWETQIYSFVFRYLGNREAARDVTQKIFFKYLQGYRNAKGSGTIFIVDLSNRLKSLQR